MKTFFDPRSVAIIGASRKPTKLSHTVLENFVKGRFKGKIYPINPDDKQILGKKAYPSVLNVKGPIDLAVIVIRAKFVPQVLTECVKKKIPSVVIVSSGFSEVGNTRAEARLKQIIKGSKTRIIGPNCLGVFDASTDVDTLFLSRARLTRPKPGSIAFISQSGAVASTMIDWLAFQNIGISKFISYGNAVDVNEAELIEFLNKDPKTKAIAVYLEGAKAGRALLTAAKKCKKPVIVLKAGKTAKGSKAVISHTGSLAGVAEVYSGAFKQAGIIEAKNWQELFDFAKALAFQPRAKGSKIAIVTDGGGFGVLATDEAEKQGLKMPNIPADLKRSLSKKLPSHVIIKNPFDLTGDATTGRYKLAIEACLKSKVFDSVLAITLLQVPTISKAITQELKKLNQLAKRQGKPLVLCASGSEYTQKFAREMESSGIPVYDSPERAVKALRATLK